MGLKLLCVVAHPDDECFAFGGALALAASRGIETYVICLTDGQAATNRGESSSNEDLGRMRREEFAASCRVLGVSRCELLDYQDGKLEFANFSEAARRLVMKVREYKPDVMLSFGLDGGLNTHPDHTMVSSLTSAAFQWAGLEKRYPDAGPIHLAQRLYMVSTDFFMEDRPAPAPMPWTVKLGVQTVREQKEEAFRQHASQAPLMERTKGMFEEHGSFEYYTLVASRKATPAVSSDDLFSGLEQ